jgi:predicted RNA methylase
MEHNRIDNGVEFDFGKTSFDYSKYRDIYPVSMYQKLYDIGIGHKNQKILDFGTGTGVFPRAMYKYGAKFTGIDVSEEQIKRLLRDNGKIIVLWMAWLPFESEIAEETEKLVLKYNPKWTGAGYKRSNNDSLNFAPETFETKMEINYTENIVFNYKTWAGRMRACRGVSATLPGNIVQEFNNEQLDLLKKLTKEPFEIIHEIRISVLKIKDTAFRRI